MTVPDSYRHAGICLTISGVMAVIWGSLWAVSLCGSTFSGVLCGPVCCFFPAGLAIVGVFEAGTGLRMQRGQRVPNAANQALLGMVGSALTFGFTMTFLELAAVLLLKRPDVQAWLAETAE